MRAELARWWGCHPINHLADRAGGYRRIAIGLAAIPVPLCAAAAGTALDEGRMSSWSAIAHVVAAFGCGWLAIDLIRTGSAFRPNAVPHPGSVVLLAGIILLVVLARAEPVDRFGSPVLLVVGLAALVGGYVVVMSAEWNRDRVLAMAGRSAVAGGAALVGAMLFVRSFVSFPSASIEALGLGVVAVALLVTGWCEARVLWRGAALYRALAQR